MTEISIAKLYDLYLDTVGRCTSELHKLSDEEIGYNLFEEFDAGAQAFLHDDNLNKLHRAGFIDNEMVEISRQVRERWLALQKHSWSIEAVKTTKEWQELFELCDRLKLKTKRP